MTTIHPIELPKPDYAFIYAKLARHVAAAAAAMCGGQLDLTRDELNEAMEAIAMFERTSMTFIIETDDN